MTDSIDTADASVELFFLSMHYVRINWLVIL